MIPIFHVMLWRFYIRLVLLYASILWVHMHGLCSLLSWCMTEGDEVLLKATHIQMLCPSTKLDSWAFGLFIITKKISANAYKLDLPACHRDIFFHRRLLGSDGDLVRG